jgi:hypothetical protein
MNPTWTQLEEQVYQRAVHTHAQEVDLAHQLERQLLSGFELIQGTKTSGAVQELGYLLCIGGTNFLHVAFDLALKGYYAQSLSLTRSAFEFWLAGAYLVSEPEQASRLKERDSKWPPPKEMRKRISQSFAGEDVRAESIRRALEKTYDYLCRFPHPAFFSLGSVYDSDKSLRIGPFYNRNRLLICVDNAYRTATLLGTLLETCFSTLLNAEWRKRSEALGERVDLWARTVVDTQGD